MIKFFRRIRQSLIMENKTSKYLKYAIGEIVLVVIGILIALQINNWNENQKEIRLEKTIKTGIIKELKKNLQSIDNVIAFHKKKQQAYQSLPSDFEKTYVNNREILDSLVMIVINLNDTFFPADGVFQSSIADNQLSQFSDAKFFQNAIILYKSTYTKIKDNSNMLDNRYDYMVRKYAGLKRTGQLTSIPNLDLNELANDLNYYILQSEYYVKVLEMTKKEIQQLIENHP